ncbi:MAG TPA: gliding motility protein GldL [Bacteroidia bacterium]|jgi:gliding motility-associated protein GldL|nr:gliding motility protein GldL [Bacteroidia bacterium]
MGFKEFLSETKRGKDVMNKFVCWGASVVIIGALFKIQHYPGATIALITGLSTEALIFLVYGILPPHEDVDWSLVYPELAGLHGGGDEHGEKEEAKGSITEQLDDLLEEAKIGPELIESLGSGLKSLSENTAKMSGIADASVATGEYVNNVKNASKNISDLSNSSSKAAESLGSISDSDISGTTKNYVNKIQSVADSMSELNSSSSKAAETLKGLSVGNPGAYVEHMEKMATNVAALNSVYEMQLKSSNDQVKASGALYESISRLVENVGESVEDTRRYKTEMSQLVQNLESLNTVYGGMLTAMNMKR